MIITKANNLACPLDGTPLTLREKQYLCANGHSYDVARQGYVHLLPVQNKKSREPGDSTAMVQARSRFLNAGFYAPISNKLNELALKHLPEAVEICVVDAGCGEGYYLDHFCMAVISNSRPATASLVGLDIAKPAILAAAKRNKQITWMVASNTNPALLPASVDMIFCMFGFPDFEAFKSILKPDGKLVLVEAGQDHLLELREIIYPEVKKSLPPSLEKAQKLSFELIDQQPLRYQTDNLNHEQITDLLVMTPHLYRATRQGKEAAAKLESISLTVDVLFRVLKLPKINEQES